MLTPERARQQLAETPDYPSCTCLACKDMCKVPCLPTPEEATRLIEEGFAEYLMLDNWVADKTLPYVEYLSAASQSYEGGRAPLDWYDVEPCVFQAKGLCDLHDLGLKPTEGRKAGCKAKVVVHVAVIATWNTREGREVVDRWRKMMQV